jgi:DNA polymerase-3 subunit epsilon
MASTTQKDQELERYAEQLTASGDYRVLRRFEAFTELAAPDPLVRKFRGVFLDVETTGVDPLVDTIIELAMVPFEYSADGRIFAVGQAFTGLNDPGRELSAVITQLTGITDEMLQGQALDPEEVAAFLQGTHLIIAHNAAFDRVFFERFFPHLHENRWACSLREVPWDAYGVEGHKLEYIAYRAGVFFEGHRAEVDCQVALHALALTWPGQSQPALADLRENALITQVQLWAVNSPFDSKDALKARGYRWNPELRAWHTTLPEEQLDGEKDWLASNVYARELRRGPVTLRAARLDSTNRYRGNVQPDFDVVLGNAKLLN